MPASSKQQQKLMGIVHAIQKGDAKSSDFSKKAQKMAKDMNPSDVKDFATTPTKNLPSKKESVIREDVSVIPGMTITTMMALGGVGVLSGILATYFKNIGGASLSDVKTALVDTWKDLKRDKVWVGIVDKLKDDPDVKKMANNKDLPGWKKMLATKLDDKEIKYINSIYKNYFADSMKTYYTSDVVKDFNNAGMKNIMKNLFGEGTLNESPKINWTEFYQMAKDTDGYNPQFEKKYGHLVKRPHIADALKRGKNFSQFMQIIKPFEEGVDKDCNCLPEATITLTLKNAMSGIRNITEKKK